MIRVLLPGRLLRCPGIADRCGKAGSTDYDAVTKALRSEYVETPVGKIKFDAKGDAEGVGFSVYTVKDGQFLELM